MPGLKVGNVASNIRVVYPKGNTSTHSDNTPKESKTSGELDGSGIGEVAPELEGLSERYGLEIGNTAPDFCLTSTDGNPIKLSDFRGTKVMLCFYRFAYCPYAACALKKLMGALKKLAWAARLKVVTVFLTDNQTAIKGTTDPKAPIQTLWRKENKETPFNEYTFPFIPLADKEGTVFSQYKVKTCSFTSLIGSSAIHSCELLKAMTPSGVLGVPRELQYGGLRSLHTELLLDEAGVIVDVFRAKAPKESMEMERIIHFLLRGQRLLMRPE